jgi:hypothetical protein
MVVSHEDIDARVRMVEVALDRGVTRFDTLDGKIDAIALALEPLPRMQADIAATKEIVEAYTAVKNAGKFIKWFSGIAVALAALWAVFRAGVKALVP